MNKKYFYIILLFLSFSAAPTYAQEGKSSSKVNENTIDGLSVYPNPVTNGRVYIISKLGDDKEIVVFDVLGKKVLQTILTSKELNISSLNPGVYIIQIKEGDSTATRKLIVK